VSANIAVCIVRDAIFAKLLGGLTKDDCASSATFVRDKA